MTGSPAERAPAPEQIAFPRFDQLTAEGIKSHADGSIAVAEYHVDRIKGAPGENRPLTWDNTVGELQKALEAIGFEGEGGRWPMLMADVHPDQAIRIAANDAYGRQDASMLGMYADGKLYSVFKTFSESSAASRLKGERALALAVVMKEFEMAGQGLEDAGKRAKLLELKTQLRELGQEFGRNIAGDAKQGFKLEEDDKQAFSPEQLDSYLPRDEKGNIIDPDDHRIPLNKPAVDAVLENTPNRDLRRRVYEAFNSLGAPKNLAVLTKAANTRLEIAKTLGYRSWADLQTAGQALGSPEAVLDSYERLRTQVTRETGQLLADIKGTFGLEHDVEPYDIPYYVTQMRKELDAQISEFLPFDNVINGMSSIANELFGVHLREITEFADQHEGKWHNSVRFYEIRDRDGSLLGGFGIDPHPRPGKRGGAATYTLNYPNETAPGEHNTPTTVIVANLTPPSAEGEQAKLTPYDVRALFHEFGHVLHVTFGKTETVRLAGDNNVQEDFRELVSVFSERLADDPTTLRHLSTGEIPAELVDSYARAQRITSLLLAQRNLRFGRLDLAIHGAEAALDVADLQALRLQAEEFSGIREGEVGAGWPASFRHALSSRYGGRMQVYTSAAEQALAIQDLFNQAGDGRGQIAWHLRTMMERGGAEVGSELLRQFLEAAQDTLRETAMHRGLGSTAAGSTKPQ